MYVINYKIFSDKLYSDFSGGDYVPINSPVLIFFSLKNKHSKHSILKEFNRHLKLSQIDWIKPLNLISEEWVLDLSLLKESYDILNREQYLSGKITLDPVFEQKEEIDEITEESIVVETRIKFKIDPNELFIYENTEKLDYITDIKPSLVKFGKDYPNNKKCAFLMMKFEDSTIQSKIVLSLKDIFKKHNITLMRADEKHYSDDLLVNIRTYMHGCSFGVAVFERINSDYFNPNVSLEVGYMMALKKPIMFLKEKTLKSLHTDLIGKLYEEFDFQNLHRTIDKAVTKWLKNHELI